MNNHINCLNVLMINVTSFQPISVASSSTFSFRHNKLIVGLDATGDDDIIGDNKEQWKDGHVLTFWAYDYNFPGTKEYYIYFTQNNQHGVMNETQRYTLSPIKTIEENAWGWYMKTSFWAFEDYELKKFISMYRLKALKAVKNVPQMF